MRVLHRVAYLTKKYEARRSREVVLIAVFCDRNSWDQLHHKIGTSAFRRSGVEHAGDIRMVHHRQRLAFGLEARDDVFGVHPELDDFKGYAPPHRFLLFGHPYDAATAFAELLQEL